MRGIVWGSTQDIATNKLIQVIKEYSMIGIIPDREVITKHNAWVKFENGDYWVACGSVESARGYKANISYVDRAINKDFFNIVIKHCTIGFPYRGFLFFGEGELNEYDT